MKKLILIVSVVMTQHIFAQIPTNGLSVQYPFNGNVNDTSGNNYHSTVANPTYTADRNGNVLKSIQTGTSGSYALQHNYSAHVANFKTQSFSYGCWLKFDNFIPNQYPYVMSNGALNDNFFRFFSDGTNAILQTGYRVNDPFSVQYRTLTVYDLEDYFLEWTHYMVTSDYNASNDTRIVKLFVNGQLHQTASYTFSESQILYNPAVNALELGANLNGALDDFIYYSRALTPAEVFIVYGECFTTEQVASVSVLSTTLTIDGISYADFQWVDCDNSNAPISGATSQSYTPTVSGNYALEISGNGCTEMSDCNLICILNPTVNISGNTLSAMQSGSTYQWIDCNNSNAPISGATGQSYTPTTSGSYAVIISNGSCSETSACQSVTLSFVEIEEQTAMNFNLYPNPANSTVSVSNMSVGSALKIVDITGKVISSSQVTTPNIELSTDFLSNGIYIIQIENNGAVAQKKLVVNK